MYSHSNKVRRRFISGEKRKAISQILEHSPPSVLKFKMLSKVSEDISSSGNRNDAPSDVVVQKISSDRKELDDLDVDFHKFLLKLTEQYVAEEKYNGQFIKGLIQTHIIYPFLIVLFTERQVRYAVAVIRERKIFAHLDSTGTIIKYPPGGEKIPYYYSVILAAIPVILPAFPLMEFISSCHNADFLSFILELFVSATKYFLKEGDTKPVIDKVKVDWTLALMQATSRSFNNMSLLRYLKVVWQKLNKNTGKLETDLDLTVIHNCSSHLINRGRKRIKAFIVDDIARRYQGFVLTALIHSTDIYTAAQILIYAGNVFGSAVKMPHFDEALNNIKAMTSTGEYEANDNTENLNDSPDEEDDNIISSALIEESPFYNFVVDAITDTLDDIKLKANKKPRLEKNKFFSPSFVNYLIKQELPLYPLISGLVIQLFGIKRDTNNAIENWMGFVKNIEFGRIMRNLIPRFIQRHEPTMDGRIKEVMFGITTTRQIQAREKRMEVTDEGDDTYKIAIKDESKATVPRKEWEKQKDKITLSVSDSDDFEKLLLVPVSENIVVSNNVLIHKPWSETKMPSISNGNVTIYGITLDRISFNSLETHQEVDNCIIDAFISLLSAKYHTNILNFPTDIVKILTEDPQNDRAIIDWCQRIRAKRYDSWLLPIHDNKVHGAGHWTLLSVVFSQKTIIYFDSLHRCPEDRWLFRLDSLIERVLSKQKKEDWRQWIFFSPQDVPEQGKLSDSSNNCEGHVLTWSFLLYSGETIHFDESDMENVRKWILSSLLKSNLPKRGGNSFVEMPKTTEVLQSVKMKIKQIRGPANYFNSTLEYAHSFKTMIISYCKVSKLFIIVIIVSYCKLER